MRRLSLLFIASCLPFLGSSPVLARESLGSSTSGAAVVREMNLARQHPDVYAGFLAVQRDRYRGNICVQPNGALLRTREGVAGLDDAIHFLRRTQPLGALSLSNGISLGAAEHVADQAKGAFGHGGSDRSDPGTRMNRHGTWSVKWGENISYGKSSAREIVMALIVDDGLRGRKHRANIFNPAFNYAGAAVGPHARYRTVCSIDFAGRYVEQGNAAREPLFAGN